MEDMKRGTKNTMISQKCLGMVLRRCGDHHQGEGGVGGAEVETYEEASEDWMLESGFLIFQDFQEANRSCYWNQTLVDSVNNVEYMGYVAPGTLLMSGNEYYLEGIRSAWGRRVLKPPAHFIIMRLGDVTGMEIQVIPQTQFTPLPEALCLVICQLNTAKETASLPVLHSRLQEIFCDLLVPKENIVYHTLGKLIKDRKIYHTSDGYFIVTPETYRLTTVSPLPERPMLLTTEEAILKLHEADLHVTGNGHASPTSCTRSVQTLTDDVTDRGNRSKGDRYASLRLSRKDKHKSLDGDGLFTRIGSMKLSPEKSKSLIKDINLKSNPVHQDIDKGEKVSVFSKLFRRGSSKRRKRSKSPSVKLSSHKATFAAQFPPLEWNDDSVVHFHSRSTQTLEHSERGRGGDEGRHHSACRTVVTPLQHNARSATTVADSSTQASLPLKSKAGSLSRLKDQQERHSLHVRNRSSTLESCHAAAEGKVGGATPLTTPQAPPTSPPRSSSIPRYPRSSTSSLKTTESSSASPASVKRAGPTLTRREAPSVGNKVQLATAASKPTEEKIKNTESNGSQSPRRHKYVNRWSVHGTETGQSESPVTSSPVKHFNKLRLSTAPPKLPALSGIPSRQMSLPLHQQSVAPPSEPLNNTTTATTTAKVVNVTNGLAPITPSPSINECFDIEASFKSITARKILRGISVNSIDTLVEVNLAAEQQQQKPVMNNLEHSAIFGSNINNTKSPKSGGGAVVTVDGAKIIGVV